MANNRNADFGQQNTNMGRAPMGQAQGQPQPQQRPRQAQPYGQPASQSGRSAQPNQVGANDNGMRRPSAPRSGKNGTGSAANATPAGKRTILVVIGIIVAAIAIWVLVWLFACNGNGLLDPTARDGQAPYKTAEEMQAELDRVVEEGMFNISIQSNIIFDNGESSGTANIENVPGNHYLMQVVITDDDTGDLLYESGILKPNQFIEKITLAKDLDAGTYNATATFKALDETTYDEVGQAAAKVTISVLE